jgi:succinate-semialdehyde dehydrogenase/glutarate-semialdehyde dehydrogenase
MVHHGTSKRGSILLRAGHLILQQEKERHSAYPEQGKPLRESILEIRRFVHTLDHYGGMAKSFERERWSSITAVMVWFCKPLGVCGAIVPWNFGITHG